jgi:UDP-glucose 4-epimerase
MSTMLQIKRNAGYGVVGQTTSKTPPEAPRCVAELTELSQNDNRIQVVNGDVRCLTGLDTALKTKRIKEPSKHCLLWGSERNGKYGTKPLNCLDRNVAGSQKLRKTVQDHCIRAISLTDSASLHGYPAEAPNSENGPIQPINPHASSKATAEQILADVFASIPRCRIARLRSFYPIGAYPSGKIGEDPNGSPNNLLPYSTLVAIGHRQTQNVFEGRVGGNIHAVDSAKDFALIFNIS